MKKLYRACKTALIGIRTQDAASKAMEGKIEAVINDIVRNADPLPFAQSEKFDILTTHFPELKERFLLASAKKAALTAAAKAAKSQNFSAEP